MSEQMSYHEYEEVKDTLSLSCDCGWSGMASEAYGEHYEAVLDFECPQCVKILLVVSLIADPEKYLRWLKNRKKQN